MVIFPLTPRIPSFPKPWGARMMAIPPSNASISPRRCPWIYWDFGDQWPSTAAHVTSLGRKTSTLGGCCSHGISRFPKWFMMFLGWMWMRDTSHGISRFPMHSWWICEFLMFSQSHGWKISRLFAIERIYSTGFLTGFYSFSLKSVP